MIKIFVLMLVVAMLTFSKTASAGNIDWNSAPRFNNQVDFVDYLNRCKYDLKTFVPVVFTNGFSIPNNENIHLVRAFCWLSYTNYGSDGQNTKMLYEITNYPGERVAYAYLHNDTSFLNDEEIQLYNEAVKIVNAAKYNHPNSALLQELYIYNEIMGRTTYFTERGILPKYARYKTATGVLIDGRANCQGYSDAFYMLATMCGFKVDKINGYGNNDPHTWNTITFEDGRSYFVDVTLDDATFRLRDGKGVYNTNIYFNAPTDVVAATHRWFPDYVPLNLQQYPDGRYFFYTQEYENSKGKFFGAHSNSAEDALQHIGYNIARRGWRFSYVAAPYNAAYTDVNYCTNHLLNDILLSKYGWRGTITVSVAWRGNYLFFLVDAVAN